MTTTSRRRTAVPRPRVWPIRASDLVAIVAANDLLILGMWVRHGGLSGLSSTTAVFTALGQLTALYGTYIALIQIVLMSRSPWLEQLFGFERLINWHRRLGFTCLALILGHTVFTTIGYALGDGSSVLVETWTLIATYPYVLMAWVGLALFVLVALTSIRAARRRLSYETWYFIHLYAYLGVALAFFHQLVVGTDFADDPVATGYWIGLYVIAAALVLVFRFGQPIALSVRHRLAVAGVAREAPGVVSIYVTGRNLDQLAVRAGQHFRWRFLARDGWWHAHPFSLSAAPNGEYLRLTVKDSGDWSSRLQFIHPGTRVFAEGPYGTFTGERRRRAKVLLVAGGVGITPLRALFEELPTQRNGLTLLYRATSPGDVIFRDELDALVRTRGATLHMLVGKREDLPVDPLGPAVLRQLVPDIRERDVFVCGPEGMIDHVRASLGRVGVPAGQIHFERFAF